MEFYDNTIVCLLLIMHEYARTAREMKVVWYFSIIYILSYSERAGALHLMSVIIREVRGQGLRQMNTQSHLMSGAHNDFNISELKTREQQFDWYSPLLSWIEGY